uniref:Uncharacterized protein n=1 Tax=Phytophthora ramorum TaxID=164328 RepID=H3GVJ6_PHYRM
MFSLFGKQSQQFQYFFMEPFVILGRMEARWCELYKHLGVANLKGLAGGDVNCHVGNDSMIATTHAVISWDARLGSFVIECLSLRTPISVNGREVSFSSPPATLSSRNLVQIDRSPGLQQNPGNTVVDIGTTPGCVGVWHSSKIPHHACSEREEVIVGDTAVNKLPSHAENTIFHLKLLLGKAHANNLKELAEDFTSEKLEHVVINKPRAVAPCYEELGARDDHRDRRDPGGERDGPLGGSTRIPLVQNLIKKYFEGKNMDTQLSPDDGVAFGATIEASGLAELVGVPEPKKLLNLIPLNLSLFTTSEDNQEAVFLHIYEDQRLMAKDKTLVAQLSALGITPKEIKVTFTVSTKGVLTVTASERKTGQKSLEVMQDCKRLTSADDDQKLGKLEDAAEFEAAAPEAEAASAPAVAAVPTQDLD